MKKTFDSIDLAKFIASIFVFAMHCNVLSDYTKISMIPELLARWGVPFFFICSAYFLFSKSVNGNISKDILNRYIYRIGMLYVVWLVYNIPNVIYQRLWSKDLSSISTWLIFIKNSVLSSTFIGSWYLTSSIFSAWFVYTLSKKLPTKSVMGITFVFYLLSVFTSAYDGLLPSSLSNTLKFLCFPLNIFNGCFYFSLGKYIAENKLPFLVKYDKRYALAGFIVFYLLFIVEIGLTKYYKICGGTEVAFCTVLLAVSLFLFCLQTNIKISNSIMLRKMSTIIYCSQGNVLLLNGICKKILKIPSVLAFLISSFAIAVICVLVFYIQKNKKWKWTKYLT